MRAAVPPVGERFQSTLPRGSDLTFTFSTHSRNGFQSTLPRGSDGLDFVNAQVHRRFNPRSREEATQCRTKGVGSAPVSIHAPARKRLGVAALGVPGQRVSIHAPARKRRTIISATIGLTMFQSTLPRGSDFGQLSWDILLLRFQSTLPRGSDWTVALTLVAVLMVSIHAPARKRPAGIAHSRPAGSVSIHAPARKRLRLLSATDALRLFQSTLPRGSDTVF